MDLRGRARGKYSLQADGRKFLSENVEIILSEIEALKAMRSTVGSDRAVYEEFEPAFHLVSRCNLDSEKYAEQKVESIDIDLLFRPIAS